MTGVAYNGSSVSQTSKSGHVTYDIENWIEPFVQSGMKKQGHAWTGEVEFGHQLVVEAPMQS